MADNCTDTNIGTLLHAWELDALDERDSEDFEKHLLSCDFCLARVLEFEPEIALLHADSVIKVQAEETAAREGPTSFFGSKLWDRLWPDTLIVFRPAFALLVILILLFPAYLGLTPGDRTDLREVQSLSLYPARSIASPTLRVSSGQDAVIAFVFDSAVTGGRYEVEIRSEDGSVLYADNAFGGFDQYNIGRLLLPNDLMSAGRFQLIIMDSAGGGDVNKQVYDFLIID